MSNAGRSARHSSSTGNITKRPQGLIQESSPNPRRDGLRRRRQSWHSPDRLDSALKASRLQRIKWMRLRPHPGGNGSFPDSGRSRANRGGLYLPPPPRRRPTIGSLRALFSQSSNSEAKTPDPTKMATTANRAKFKKERTASFSLSSIRNLMLERVELVGRLGYSSRPKAWLGNFELVRP